MKMNRVDLENFILKYDVIHAALKVICNRNLKQPRNKGDIGLFGDIWVLAGIKLKIVNNVCFFSAI
jgi:hypothetical protein